MVNGETKILSPEQTERLRLELQQRRLERALAAEQRALAAEERADARRLRDERFEASSLGRAKRSFESFGRGLASKVKSLSKGPRSRAPRGFGGAAKGLVRQFGTIPTQGRANIGRVARQFEGDFSVGPQQGGFLFGQPTNQQLSNGGAAQMADFANGGVVQGMVDNGNQKATKSVFKQRPQQPGVKSKSIFFSDEFVQTSTSGGFI